MNSKLVVGVSFAFILLLSLCFVIAEEPNLSTLKENQYNNKEDLKNIREDRFDYIHEQRDKLKNVSNPEERREIINETREEIRDSIREGIEVRRDIKQNRTEIRDIILENRSLRVQDKEIRFLEAQGNRKEILVGKINARTGLNLTVEDLGNGTILQIMLKNGENRTLNYLPDSASKIAEESLGTNCEVENCTIEIKEAGENRVAYEVETQREAKFLLFFDRKMSVRAEIDSETGELISIKKPWWAFLAKEESSVTP